tara:strand:- start:97 stop:297 length:201 start_codon:yes stop_codon:yes gene_type:complete
MAKKINKLSDFNNMLVELNSLRKSLLNLRFQKATGQLEKTSEIKKSRRKIAKLITKIDQKQRLENV